MKSYLFKVWLWCAISLIVLIGLRYLPEMNVFAYSFKPVDIVAEVISTASPDDGNLVNASEFSEEGLDSDHASEFLIVGENLQGTPASAKPRSEDGLELPLYTIPIEDFGIDRPAMEYFYQSLKTIKSQERSVHLAFFGDSFIEGDLITDRLRDTLQQVFGGKGIGYVPLASPSNLSKNTIVQAGAGFTHRSAVDTGRTGRIFSISGYLTVPTEEKNQVTYHGIRNSKTLQWFENVTLFYQSPRNSSFYYRAGSQSEQVRLLGGRELKAYSFQLDSARNISLSFSKDSTLTLHGLNFESGPGIYVDNFSQRGTSGHAFFRTNPNFIQASDSLLNYGLIIVQYGLNVLSPGQTDYSHYTRTLKQVIEYLQDNFPEKSILIIGVGDRSERKDGQFQTMAGLESLIQIQRNVAKECGVAFWDLYEAMGGAGSMVRFVDYQPALANKDYTHINRKGGVVLANQLAKTLLSGYAAYR